MSNSSAGISGISLLVVGIILYLLWSQQITWQTAIFYGILWFIGLPVAIIAIVLFVMIVIAGIATVTNSW